MYQEIVIDKGSRLPGNHFNPLIIFSTIIFFLLFSAPNKFPIRKTRSHLDFSKSVKINRKCSTFRVCCARLCWDRVLSESPLSCWASREFRKRGALKRPKRELQTRRKPSSPPTSSSARVLGRISPSPLLQRKLCSSDQNLGIEFKAVGETVAYLYSVWQYTEEDANGAGSRRRVHRVTQGKNFLLQCWPFCFQLFVKLPTD